MGNIKKLWLVKGLMAARHELMISQSYAAKTPTLYLCSTESISAHFSFLFFLSGHYCIKKILIRALKPSDLP